MEPRGVNISPKQIPRIPPRPRPGSPAEADEVFLVFILNLREKPISTINILKKGKYYDKGIKRTLKDCTGDGKKGKVIL